MSDRGEPIRVVPSEPLGFGGKGSSLEWLQGHNYSCPSFDLIDAGVWRSLVAEPRFRRYLSTLRFGSDQLSFQLACHELRQQIASATLPAPVVEWLKSEPLRRLGSVVAVRSSALSEDVGACSSAGQYESILGVSDAVELERAVRDVVASYYGDRAVLYRRSQRIDDGFELAMGIIIQEMIPSYVSGIAFSVDPVTGNGDFVVIEASWGLGPTIVCGLTEPDRFTVSRDPQSRRVATHIGRKDRTLTYDAQSASLVESDLVTDDNALCLSDLQVLRLADDVGRMAQEFGCPVDVEWAIASPHGPPVYLQVRPVTASAASTSTQAISLVPTF